MTETKEEVVEEEPLPGGPTPRWTEGMSQKEAAEHAKAEGNRFFQEKDFKTADVWYDAGLECGEYFVPNLLRAQILSNSAETKLRLGANDVAADRASEALNFYGLPDDLRVKTLVRKAKALKDWMFFEGQSGIKVALEALEEAKKISPSNKMVKKLIKEYSLKLSIDNEGAKMETTVNLLGAQYRGQMTGDMSEADEIKGRLSDEVAQFQEELERDREKTEEARQLRALEPPVIEPDPVAELKGDKVFIDGEEVIENENVLDDMQVGSSACPRPKLFEQEWALIQKLTDALEDKFGLDMFPEIQKFLHENPQILKRAGDVAKALFSLAVASYEKRDFMSARKYRTQVTIILACSKHGTERFFQALTPAANEDKALRAILKSFMREESRVLSDDGLYEALDEVCTLSLKKQVL